jgi:hypothetical protein
MPYGKPAGQRCIQLTDDLDCAIFNSSERPKVCKDFRADRELCGENRDEALKIMSDLEG